MNRISYLFRLIVAVTFATAHNLFRLGGLQTLPMRMCVVGDDDIDEINRNLLRSLDRLEISQKEKFSDFDRFQKETKRAFEELTLVKNEVRSMKEIEIALRKTQISMRRENRLAYGDPVERIVHDEEARSRLNIAVRLAVSTAKHDLSGVCRDISPQLTQLALEPGATPGSTLITSDLSREIYDVLSTFGAWKTLGVRPVGTGLTKFPVTTALPVAKAIRKLSGAKLVEDTTLAGTSVDAEVVLWGVLLGVQNELLEDAKFDVTAYVMNVFAEAMAFRMDTVGFVASGTDDEYFSAMTGMFSAGTAAAAASGNTTVETLDFADIIKCLTTVSSVVLQRRARWWMHPTMLARMISLTDGNGRPIFLSALEAPSYGALGSILGYPVTVSGALPNTNSANQPIAAFGDGDSQVFGLRTDFAFEASNEFAFSSAQRTFRALARFGTKNRAATGAAILKTAAS